VFGSIFAVGLVVAFFAQVMRIPIRRERQVLEGNPPKELTLRGIRPAKSHRWWWATWDVKTPEGWTKADRMLRVISIVGVVVAVVALLVAIALK
jgi:hypothetical protein